MTSIYDVEQIPLKDKVSYLREFIDTQIVPEGRFDLYEGVQSLLLEYDSLTRNPRLRKKLESEVNLFVRQALSLEKSLSEEKKGRQSIVSLDSILNSSMESKVETIERYIERYPEDDHVYNVLLERLNNDWATEAELTNAVARILSGVGRLSSEDQRRFSTGEFLVEARSYYEEEALPRDSMRLILSNFISDGNAICSFLRTSKWIYETASEPSILLSLKKSVMGDNKNNKKLIDSAPVESDDFIDWYESNYYTSSCRISPYSCTISAFYYRDYRRLLMDTAPITIRTARKLLALVDASDPEEEKFLKVVRQLSKRAAGLGKNAISDMYGAYCKSLVNYQGNCSYFLSLLEVGEAKSYFRLVQEQFLLKTQHQTFHELLQSGVKVYGSERFINLLAINEKSLPKPESLKQVKQVFSDEAWVKYSDKYQPFLADLSGQLSRTKEKIYGMTRSSVQELLQILG